MPDNTQKRMAHLVLLVTYAAKEFTTNKLHNQALYLNNQLKELANG